MFVKTVDSKPVFATHLIKINVDMETKMRIPFQIEGNNIICYSKEETIKAIKLLKKLKIKYTIKPLDVAKKKEIDKNIKFKNRNEVIEYLQKQIVPEDKEKKDLYKRIERLEKQVKYLMNKLNKI